MDMIDTAKQLEVSSRTQRSYRLPDETLKQIELVAMREETNFTEAICIAVQEAAQKRKLSIPLRVEPKRVRHAYKAPVEKKPIGRPRKYPKKPDGTKRTVGRPRKYPKKPDGTKRPVGRPRKDELAVVLD